MFWRSRSEIERVDSAARPLGSRDSVGLRHDVMRASIACAPPAHVNDRAPGSPGSSHRLLSLSARTSPLLRFRG